MANILNLGLRGVQFLLILLITALVGNAIAEAVGGNPSGVNFAIFVAVWCWLTWIVGTAADFTGNDGFGKLVGIADIVSALLAVIAGIVLAAKLGVHSCGNQSYLASNGYVNGSHHRGKRCHELQASTAFFFFLFATYCVTAAFSWKNSTGGLGAGGLRKGAPSMRQV